MPGKAVSANPESAPALAARLVGVGKAFGGVWACRNIDLEIRAGEVHAVMGENGAGKSTLMKMLHGGHLPDEGVVEIAGREMTLSSAREAEAAGVAMVPQELDLFPDLSVVENLFVGRRRPRGRFGGFDRAEMRRRAAVVFERLNAPIDLDADAGALSGAAGQLVEIARALMYDAKVLILDEPTAALTEREARRLLSIVRELTAEGVAVLYVSHRLEEVFEIADRITVLRDGERVRSGPTAAFDTAGLIQTMVGRPLDTLFHRTRRAPGEALLEVRGLSRRGAFRDVAFTLRRGEIVGLAGLIGAGRSEVAQAVFGLQLSTGEVVISGRPVRLSGPQDAIRHGLIYVPEERRAQGLVLDYPVDWNIAFSALDRVSAVGLVSRKRETALAERYRQLFAIKSAGLGAPVVTLSGGNQQKVLLAKALATEPEIILLDEPTRGVDVGAKAEIYRIIDDLAAAGKAILMISSEMNELLSMADRILVMHQGRLTGSFGGPDFDANAIGAAAAGVAAERSEEAALHPGGLH